MEFAEIPDKNRGLGRCTGCKQRHRCSWRGSDQRDYCEDCKKSRCGENKTIREIKPPHNEPDNTTVEEINKAIANPLFSLSPERTINLTIGQLKTGWVISMDGENEVFTTKRKVLAAIEDKMSVRKLKDRIKEFDKELKEGKSGTDK